MNNKTIPPPVKTKSVEYTLVDDTWIRWDKTETGFMVTRKIVSGPLERIESTDLSPTSECAYYLLNSDEFKVIEL